MSLMRALFGLALVLSAGHVSALDLPKGSSRDSRIQTVDYSELDVVEVNSLSGVGTQIVFAEGEEILDVASGFSQGWEVANRRNNLYLKPKSVKLADGVISEPEAGKWDTNLLVTTDRRAYAFHLVLQRSSDKALGYNAKVAFRIVFRYPADEAKALAEAEKRTAAAAKMDRQAPPRNWTYSMQIGEQSADIAPSMAYDDGRFTYLKFPGVSDMPVAFLVAEDGSESVANTHIDPREPDVLVVQRVARQMVLRLGEAVVGVYNEAFDRHGLPPTHGTSVPGVKRTLKGDGSAQNAPDEDMAVITYTPGTGARVSGIQDPRTPYLPPGYNGGAASFSNSNTTTREDTK